jgi:membrane protease YdiL (CAAX protease family)
MTPKRLILTLLTVMVVGLAGISLASSWNQPQIQSRLELYQTNLLLHGSEFEGESSEDPRVTVAQTLLGQELIQTALNQYQAVRDSNQEILEKNRDQLKAIEASFESNQMDAPSVQAVKTSIKQAESFLDDLNIRIGLLQVYQGEVTAGQATWSQLSDRTANSLIDASEFNVKVQIAQTLSGLWHQPPHLERNAEKLLQTHLNGWFRYQALSQLYQLQGRSQDLTILETQEQELASQALVKLIFIGGLPVIGVILGGSLIVFMVVQVFLKPQEAILTLPSDTDAEKSWQTPWDWEIIWQVIIVGFFSVQQIFLPLVISLLPIKASELGVRLQCEYVLGSYVLLAGGGLLVLYLSLKPFFPLPEGWFRFNWRSNWLVWGFGGYLVALPLVILVSVINQQIWQGQGGSNPLLPIALDNQDSLALVIFFFTASVAAPLFEEVMFRGFLLPSLTRYQSPWSAIALSSILFAVAHLSVSEVLPLATLGMVLGFIYVRSGNLLAPMLLHCLWNSGTLVSLFILGSSAT